MRNAERTLLLPVRWLAWSEAYITAPTGKDWIMHTNGGQLRLVRARTDVETALGVKCHVQRSEHSPCSTRAAGLKQSLRVIVSWKTQCPSEYGAVDGGEHCIAL